MIGTSGTARHTPRMVPPVCLVSCCIALPNLMLMLFNMAIAIKQGGMLANFLNPIYTQKQGEMLDNFLILFYFFHYEGLQIVPTLVIACNGWMQWQSLHKQGGMLPNFLP